MNENKNTQKDVFDKTVSLSAKLIRWGLYGLVGLIILSLLSWGAMSIYTYLTKTRHENNVLISIYVSEESCSEKEFPITVAIKNNSEKTIKNIIIYPSAHREGHSKDLASSARIESDKIIKPQGINALCWRGDVNYSYRDTYKPVDLVWELDTFHVDFE